MFKEIFKDKKSIIIIIIAIVVFAILFYLDKNRKPVLESSFGEDNTDDNADNNDNNDPEPYDEPEGDVNNLPGLFNVQYQISTKGKNSVFPMMLEKFTPGPIELPNRRSLLNKDAKYKFKDIMPGDKIKVVSLQNLSYTVDHNAFNDDFLVTEDDLLIAYTQAKEHFKTITN